MQNIPKREKKAKALVRSGIYPLYDYLGEVDFSGAEVKTAACYTKDKSLIKYITDPSTDMHRDSGCDIWQLPKAEISKEIRYEAKGGWVFAQFYGSTYKACALYLWKHCLNLKTTSGTVLKDHIKSKGIRHINDFIEHCQEVERIFWKERFFEYDQWKTDVNEFYRKKGYVETFMGFRYTGYMNERQVSNYPIQGTSFHILLWCLIRIFKSKGMISRIVGQIHDSIVLDIVEEEKDLVLKIVKRVMTEDLRNEFPWIIVPYNVELELAPKGASWEHTKEEEM